MSLRNSIKLFTVILLLTLVCSCKKDPVSNNEPEIPPTPTGPGDIVYTYQPGDDSHYFKIYSINADGTGNKKIITTTMWLNMPRYSPDATKIAAIGYTGYNTSIYVYNADGSNQVRLTTINYVMDMHPAWSPDGTKIAFTRMLPAENNRQEIWTMNAGGTNSRFFNEGFTPIWNSEGTKLIYSSNKSGNYELYIKNFDGTNELKLTNTSLDEANPDLSPDGTKIAYTISNGVMRGSESSFEIWVMNADGTNPHQLTNNNYSDSDPKWSPDGTLLLFTSDQSARDHYEIYTMNGEGTNIRRVTNTPGGSTAIYPSWRPRR